MIPFAAILAKHPLPHGPEAAAAREKLVRWYWCSIFGQTYENAPNSQAAKDVTELELWLENGSTRPETVTSIRFDPRLLRGTTARQKALYRGTIGLIMCSQPRDFYTARMHANPSYGEGSRMLRALPKLVI